MSRMEAGGDHVDVAPALCWAAGHVGTVSAARTLTGGWTSTMLALRLGPGDAGGTGHEVVLRLMTREPWRTHGEGLTMRESEVQRMLADTPVPAPHSLALDAAGRDCGFPAHLMSLVPGQVEADRIDASSLDRVAELLATIHEVTPTIDVRYYQSWAWEAKYVVPPWASDAALWEEAFTLLRAGAPSHESCFIHRDFQPRNLLWSGDRVSGVVDWVETSIGPAWLDVAHFCTNLAIRHGNGPADLFAEAYAARTGREPEPYFDVMDVVGFLPPPGKEGFLRDDAERRRLEDRLGSVLRRVRA